MPSHSGVAIAPTAGNISMRSALARPQAARLRAIRRGAAVRRTEQREAGRGTFRTGPPPRCAPFQNAQSAVRTATSSAAAPPSTITTKRKRPCLAARSDNRRLPCMNARALGRLRPSLAGYGASRLGNIQPDAQTGHEPIGGLAQRIRPEVAGPMASSGVIRRQQRRNSRAADYASPIRPPRCNSGIF
jgi:hypothetical protein